MLRCLGVQHIRLSGREKTGATLAGEICSAHEMFVRQLEGLVQLQVSESSIYSTLRAKALEPGINGN